MSCAATGPDRTGAIVGGVVGGLAALVVVGTLVGMVAWSSRSFAFRARKRVIEDQVHTLVLGMRTEDRYIGARKDDSQKVQASSHAFG